jgi:fumarylacetoacetase
VAPPAIDLTHDADRRSWVHSASGDESTEFPIQNLPLGVARRGDGSLALVTAIGDQVLDLAAAAHAGLLTGSAAELATQPAEARLNPLLARPAHQLTELRHQLARLLDADQPPRPELLRAAIEVTLELPCQIPNFTDFYAGIHHARMASEVLASGKLPPNYRWVPIAYQSRASTVRASGSDVPRPAGQMFVSPDHDPAFGPCAKLDFELELGFWIGAGNELGRPVSIDRAGDHIGGFCLLNDWSARDVQRWEMVPLGPFLSKSFATTISPWVITPDALRPFRAPAMAREEPDDPRPLPYLFDARDQDAGGLAVELTVTLRSALMRAHGEPPAVIVRSDARHLYWTPAQMLTHHTVNGCNLLGGDLIGTGTVSGPEPDQLGSLLERTRDGEEPLHLPNGEARGYLEDGDEVALHARCVRDGFHSIGFGPCAGTVVAVS